MAAMISVAIRLANQCPSLSGVPSTESVAPVGGLVSVPRTYYRYYYYACTGGTRWVGDHSIPWQLEPCFRGVSGVASTGSRRRQSPGSRWVGKRPSH
jgi:hypothetical protein